MSKKGRKGNRTYANLLRKCLRKKGVPQEMRMSRCHEQIREGKSVGMWR